MNCIGAENRRVQVQPVAAGKVDPFNYPMPNRRDLMSLDTIKGQQDSMKTSTVKFETGRSSSNNMQITDIFGAVPKLHGSRVVQQNKPQNNLTNHDIERSGPRQLHIGLQKNETNLKTADIEGANPQCVKFKSTRIGQNPLNPNYNLQSVTYLEPESNKFIRDQLNIDDIPGTKATKKKQLDIQTRSVMNIQDIEGTHAKQRHAQRPNAGKDDHNNYNALDYRDVTHCDFKTKRTTNPLEPSYVIRDDDGKTCEIGQVPGSKPCVLPPQRKDEAFLNKSLKTDDIHMCSIGTKGLGNFHTRERREYKNTNHTEDIGGAQTGSLKKGPTTVRNLHPLNPDYQMPGRTELGCINDAFGKRNAAQQKILERHNQKSDNALKKAGEATMGINQVSKLQEASRQNSGAPNSQAQKLDSFINK